MRMLDIFYYFGGNLLSFMLWFSVATFFFVWKNSHVFPLRLLVLFNTVSVGPLLHWGVITLNRVTQVDIFAAMVGFGGHPLAQFFPFLEVYLCSYVLNIFETGC